MLDALNFSFIYEEVIAILKRVKNAENYFSSHI